MKQWISLIHLILLPTFLFSQKWTYQGNYLSLGISYLELKDELNHGLVFRGPDLSLAFGNQLLDDQRYFQYSVLLAGGGKTTIGTWGFKWTFAPLNTHYSFGVVNSEKLNLYLGPGLRAQYSVYNYPDLHAGPIIWMSNYNLELNATAFFELGSKKIITQLDHSLLGWSSRPDLERDPYFFSTKIGDNFRDIHQNMIFGSQDTYQQTKLNISLLWEGKKRWKALSYQLEFLAYYDQAAFRQLSHSIHYTWFFKKSKS